MSMLLSPLRLGNLELPNRIVVPPMCQYSATADGGATDWHLMHYGQLALSSVGLLMVEATAVTPEGRISAHDLGLWSDANAARLGDMIKRIRHYSATPLAVQLAHAGRKGGRYPFADKTLPREEGGWQTVAPSPVTFSADYAVPAELDAAGIAGVVEAFAAAAARADRVGFDAVEIHGAHGYLLHQFLSPLSNCRADAYGGSLENRMRLLLKVFEAVRRSVSAEKPVGVRISGSDWAEGGWSIEESAVLAGELERRGCAFIHVSGGGLTPDQKLGVGPGYQVDMASAIKRAAGMPVIAVGLITETIQAESILRAGDADLIAVGRGVLYNPRWAWHAAEVLGDTIYGPIQYVRARPHARPDLFGK